VIRRLAFDDRFVERLIQEITNSCSPVVSDKIVFPDHTTPVKFVVEMNEQEFTEVFSALLTGADLTYPEKSHDVTWHLLRQLECPVSICDDIIACLEPLFDGLSAQLTAVQGDIDAIAATQAENSAQAPLPVTTSVADEQCGGATYVVSAMHQKNMSIFNAAEDGLVDSVFEMIPVIIEAIPLIASLPFDELFELVNWYFENQVALYEESYNDTKDTLICELKCFIEANDNVFDFNVWGDWLEYVGTTYPTDRAAQIFSRYSPLRQTFLNQLAALIFGQQSLQSYFDELSQQYYAGTQDPVVCVGCTCPEDLFMIVLDVSNTCIPATAINTGDITLDTGEYWFAETESTSEGHQFAITRQGGGLWLYEFDSIVSGGTVAGVWIDNRNGGQACHSFAGWIDENQAIYALSARFDVPTVVRLRIYQ